MSNRYTANLSSGPGGTHVQAQCGWVYCWQHNVWSTGCGDEVENKTGELPPGWKWCPFCGSEIIEESNE